MKKKNSFLSLIAFAIIVLFITSCDSCNTKPPSEKPQGNKITDTLSAPDTSFLQSADSLKKLSIGGADNSSSALAAEAVNRADLIAFLQSDTSSLVTFQFALDSLGAKHLMIYTYRADKSLITPSDTILFFSPTAIKCPPTCNKYSPTNIVPSN